MILDRNIITDVIEFFKDEPRDEEFRRIALAVILFLRFSEFLPGMLPALQEHESQHPREEAYTDALSFFNALSVPIERYLDLLNNRIARFGADDVPSGLVFPPVTEIAEFNFPTLWMACYLVVLKIASLERDLTLSGRTRFENLQNWLYNNAFFAPPFLFVASHFFGARRDGSILSGIRSLNVSSLKKSVRNGAWDLYALSDWHIRTKRREFSVLASRDKALVGIARKMREFVMAETMHERIFLSEDWPKPKDVDALIKLMHGHMKTLDDPSRVVNRGLTREYYLEETKLLERKLGF